MNIEHRTHTKPAFDCIRGACSVKDCPGYPAGNGRSHGIGSERKVMVSKAEHYTGPIAVNFSFGTGVYHDLTPLSHWHKAMAFDLGQHATVASYEGMYSTDCDWLGAKCFYDGSSLAGDEYLVALQRDGEEAVWGRLDAYLERFADELSATIRKIGGVLR